MVEWGERGRGKEEGVLVLRNNSLVGGSRGYIALHRIGVVDVYMCVYTYRQQEERVHLITHACMEKHGEPQMESPSPYGRVG